MLQSGVQVEEDDDDFVLEPKKAGQQQLKFDENNIEIDDKGNYINP